MFALTSMLSPFVYLAAFGTMLGPGTVPTTSMNTVARNPAADAIGRDVGAQSCSHALPSGASFGIIATTDGRPYYASPCLPSEYAWAKSLAYRPQYYVNLANPGHKSAHWAQGGPRVCHRAPKYDAGCAYDYGYRAAAAAWGYVHEVGPPGHGRWWLDVETDNTWGYSARGVAANRAVIRGALRYLRRRHHVTAGIYTETVWWDAITRGTKKFSSTPVWGGGAGSKRNARRNCLAHSITGGRALVAQWIKNGVDHDIAC